MSHHFFLFPIFLPLLMANISNPLQYTCSTHLLFGKFTLGILGRKQIQTQFTLHILNYKLLKPRAMTAIMLVICFWLIMQHDIYTNVLNLNLPCIKMN